MNDKRPVSSIAAWVLTVFWVFWVVWLGWIGRAEWGRPRATVRNRLLSAPIEKKLSPDDDFQKRWKSFERKETP